MKYLRFVFCLSLLAFAVTSQARAESDKSVLILVAKSDDQTAKVTIGFTTYLVPIDIETGLSWEDVKDGYHLPPQYADLMKQGRVKIYITCSGTSFHVIHPSGK